MEKPLPSTYAFCEECDSMCVGDFYKTSHSMHYYLCRNAAKDGVRHTFAILTEDGVKALKDKDTKEAQDALNILKTQQRSKNAAIVLGLGSTVFFIKEGIEIFRNHHNSGAAHTSHGGGNQNDHHDSISHVSHDDSLGHHDIPHTDPGHNIAGSHLDDHDHSGWFHGLVKGVVDTIANIFGH